MLRLEFEGVTLTRRIGNPNIPLALEYFEATGVVCTLVRSGAKYQPHPQRLAHAERPATPRGGRNPKTKTPNREQLGARFWWRNSEPNPRPPLDTNGNTPALSP